MESSRSMTESEVVRFVLDRLDGAYVASTGKAVADAVASGEPIEVNYQPGDGTSYGLVFVPLAGIACAPGRLAALRDDPDGGLVQWEHRFAFGVARTRGACLVCWANHGAVGLDLAVGVYVGSYLDALFGGGLASGLALQALLDAVAEHLSEGAAA